jgi:hypothetical protein
MGSAILVRTRARNRCETAGRYYEHAERSSAFLLKPAACIAMGRLIHKGGVLWDHGEATAEAGRFLLSAAALADFLDNPYQALGTLVDFGEALVSDRVDDRLD